MTANWLTVPPILSLSYIDNGLKLLLANFGSLSELALLKSLANAKNDFETNIDRSPSLGGDESRGLEEECPTFRVA